MSRVSLDEEESYGEACLSPAPSSEMDEDPPVFTIEEEVKNKIRTPKQAWSSPYLEQKLANKPLKPPPVRSISLEAAGRHIPLQNHRRSNSKGNSGPKSRRPFTAIGLCRSFQSPCAPQQSSWTSSEPKLEDVVAPPKDEGTPVGAQPDSQREPLMVLGNAIGRVAVAMAPGMLSKNQRLWAATSLQGKLSSEPLPQLSGSSAHPSSKRLMKVSFWVPPRPPRRFHTACSLALPRPVVNGHLH